MSAKVNSIRAASRYTSGWLAKADGLTLTASFSEPKAYLHVLCFYTNSTPTLASFNVTDIPLAALFCSFVCSNATSLLPP